MSGEESRGLWCLIDGNFAPFHVLVDVSAHVDHLKQAIKQAKALHDLDSSSLVVWKLIEPEPVEPDDTIARRIRSRGDVVTFATKLTTTQEISTLFPQPPPKNHVHILVQLPVSPQHLPKRPRLGSDPPHTPPSKIQVGVARANHSPPPFTLKETEDSLAAALAGFEDYIQYLATGRLDGYFDSIRREDKVTDLEVYLPLDPILLLHDLGKHQDEERIKELFIRGTVHLFGVSGSGKTRLSLDGLCQNWGFYISCKAERETVSGSCDFMEATEILQSMSTWHKGISHAHVSQNATAADCAFAMLLCARVFILSQFVECLPINTDATVARRRWTLAQVLPPRLALEGDDLFVKVLRGLRRAETNIMLQIVRSTLRALMNRRRDLFPAGGVTPLFAVIDEVQVAAEYLRTYFCSTTGTDLRPILRQMYRFFQESGVFAGIILSGTGLSMKMVKDAVGSSAKQRMQPQVFTDIGQFTREDSSQVAYIRRYLTPSGNSISDRRLLERIMHWFSGRHRLTASLIELFLHSENVPRHRVLTSFAEHLTGFKITDAIELEEGEPPISPGLSQRIRSYGRICDWERFVKGENRVELIQCLVDTLMRWTLGSQPTPIPIERDMHDIIALGVGSLGKIADHQDFDPDKNYPVYISEPLVVLSLSSLFERQSWTNRRTWMARSFRNARNKLSLGFIYEEAVLFVLVETFGGKFNALADFFHCSGSLGSRRVTLVSLKRRAGDEMQSNPVSWDAGSSDRFGLKARSPADVLDFLDDPDGKVFLFPDTHMGPDLLCFLQDEETKELIVLALQAKVSPTLNTGTWQKALDSHTPQFFYTAVGEGQRARYAPVSYPNLVNDLMGTMEMVLGPEVYMPIADSYRSKLRSHTRAQRQSTSHSTRQTPRFLRVIATLVDAQRERLQREWKGDVAVLRWDVVKAYIGSTTDLVKTTAGVVF